MTPNTASTIERPAAIQLPTRRRDQPGWTELLAAIHALPFHRHLPLGDSVLIHALPSQYSCPSGVTSPIGSTSPPKNPGHAGPVGRLLCLKQEAYRSLI